ncbi:PaaI family thioesterase [Rhodococcus sp. 2H158]
MSETEDSSRWEAARLLLEADSASRSRGIELVRVTEDELEVTMPVAAHDTNGVGVAHGGVAYFLADSAVGLAANSRRDGSHVTASATMTYLAPGRAGDTLRAVCEGPVSQQGRTSVYTVRVLDSACRTIAVLHESLTQLRKPTPTEGVFR